MSNEKEIPCKLFDIKQWIPEYSIDSVKRAALCFRESLVICMKNNEVLSDTKPIGGYCILVESIGPKANEFLVHVQSSMSIDGHFGGSKVISSATAKFHCLEEKRTEFVYEDGLHEKTIFIAIDNDFYHVKLTRTCPCDNSTETKDLSICVNSKLISEGTNILLMRYLAVINFEGTLTFESITIDGDVTESNYICTPADRMELDGHILDIYTIERKMCKEDGTIHTIRTYLTPQGRIIRHNWLDVPYLLKINPLCDPMVPCKTIRVETPLRDRWTEDIEMFSKYLDMKSAKIAEQNEYMVDHPEIKQMIADYVQTLLVGNRFLEWRNVVPLLLRQVTLHFPFYHIKPQNVVDFTIQHFKAFAKDPKAWETSTLEEDNDIDIKPQLTGKGSGVLCSVCGFYIDLSSLKNVWSTSSLGEGHEKERSEVSTRSIYSERTYDAISDTQKTDETTTSTSKVSADTPELRRTCDQCEAIVKVCDKHKTYTKCPGCLKVFKLCTKCFTIDQVLQKLKECN